MLLRCWVHQRRDQSQDWRVTAQDAEEIETHWVSFRPNAIFCPSNLLKSDMLDFWSVKDIFLGAFVEQKRPAVLAHCQEHKRGHCRTGAAVSDRTRSFLSRQLLLLVSPLDPEHGKRRSAWTWFGREEVFISGVKECRWWTSWDQRKDSMVGLYSALPDLHFTALSNTSKNIYMV